MFQKSRTVCVLHSDVDGEEGKFANVQQSVKVFDGSSNRSVIAIKTENHDRDGLHRQVYHVV